MQNEIDLNNYQVRTDLAIEEVEKHPQKEIINTTVNDVEENIKVTTIKVTKKLESEINKKKGTYITIEFEDITDFDNREKVGKVLEEEIIKLLEIKKIKDTDSCLIIGLGNDKSTPDSLGPKVIERVLVTRHLFVLNTDVKEGIRNVSAITPGVMGNTGIETSEIISEVVKIVKPKFVIIIDALAASSIERVNKTIQMTDTGIHPGSGIGNVRKAINQELLNIPVIAIGVPTVVDATTIVNDTINYLFKHISYIKNNINKNKLVVKHFDNYIDKLKNKDLNQEEKEEVIGMLGTLTEEEKKNLISEVLTSIDYNLIVTPKEIDYIINKLGSVISSSINNALHKEVTNY